MLGVLPQQFCKLVSTTFVSRCERRLVWPWTFLTPQATCTIHKPWSGLLRLHTDKKENQIFLIYWEILNGAVAKSYMTNGLFIYGEIFSHFLIYILGSPSSYMTLQLLHSEFPYIYMRKILFSFLSVNKACQQIFLWPPFVQDTTKSVISLTAKTKYRNF
jgi:hypothetical protein